jgi:4-amino-4-deoxy-L-arabinose transferase-like glycosyltransferase
VKKGACRRTIRIAAAVFVLIVVLFNLLFLLGSVPIHDWDEARHAVSALEMLQRGEYLVNTFDGVADYWNVKPVLSFWPMLAGFKIFGITPFGLRIFAALANFASAFLILIFCKKHFTLPAGLVAIVVLFTNRKFIIAHNARTGDPDALFLLFYLAALVIVLWNDKNPVRYYMASILAGLAFLTKSFHVIPLAVTLTIFFFWSNGLTLRRIAQFFAVLLFGCVPVATWAFARYQYDGLEFFRLMVSQDLLTRFSSVIEGHHGGPMFYLREIYRGFHWIYMAVISFLMAYLAAKRFPEVSSVFASSNQKHDRQLIFKMLMAIAIPILLFSLSESKLRWYTYCSYPFIAILLGVLLHHLWTQVWLAKNKMWLYALVLTVAFMFAGSEFFIIRQIIKKWDHPSAQVQEQIRILGENPETRGASLYLSDGEWTPKDIFVAKMCGNFILKAGGEKALAADSTANKFLIVKP